METNVKYTLAGTFVIVMVILIIVSTIWLSSGVSTANYRPYSVFMKESVTGLEKEGPVYFNGVEVGKIDDMIIDKNSPRLVKLVIKIKDTTPITKGTRAKLGIRFLSGAAYLALEDDGKDKRPLLSKDKEPPVIETTPSLALKLETTLNEISGSFKKLSNTFDSLFSPGNIQQIKAVLHKLSGQ